MAVLTHISNVNHDSSMSPSVANTIPLRAPVSWLTAPSNSNPALMAEWSVPGPRLEPIQQVLVSNSPGRTDSKSHVAFAESEFAESIARSF